jgi:hypothetical protein
VSTPKSHEVSTPADLSERKITANQVVGYNMAYYRWAAGLTQEELGSRLGGSRWQSVLPSAPGMASV